MPESVFYYHFKHDPTGSINNYAYEFLNIAHHTEIESTDEGALVVYRPLYEKARTYRAGKHWDARPLAMFMGVVKRDGEEFPRFSKITDPEVISKLVDIRDRMYA